MDAGGAARRLAAGSGPIGLRLPDAGREEETMRSWIVPLYLALALTAGAATAFAAEPACHDATGKFVKCPAPGAVPAAPMPNKAATTTSTSAPMPNKAPSASSAGQPAAATVGTPAGAIAKCNDGTTWTGKTHSGACSHHGGVKEWQ
jgi:hypothetical protein